MLFSCAPPSRKEVVYKPSKKVLVPEKKVVPKKEKTPEELLREGKVREAMDLILKKKMKTSEELRETLFKKWLTFNFDEKLELAPDLLKIFCISGDKRGEKVLEVLSHPLLERKEYGKLEHILSILKKCFPSSSTAVHVEKMLLLYKKGKSLKIGVFLPYSGNALSISDIITEAVFQVFGGSKDWEIIFYDEAEGKLEMDNVLLILGPLYSKDVEMIRKKGLPFITFSQKAIPRGKNIFRLNLSPIREAELLAKWAIKNGMRNFVIFYPDDPISRRISNTFSNAVSSSGGMILDTVSYNASSSDFWDVIKKVFYPKRSRRKIARFIFEEKKEIEDKLLGDEPFLKSPYLDSLFEIIYQPDPVKIEDKKDPIGGIDAIFIPDTPSRFSLFYSQLYFHGIKGVNVLGVSFVNDPNIPKKIGDLPNPVFITGYYPFKRAEKTPLLGVITSNLLEALKKKIEQEIFSKGIEEIMRNLNFLEASDMKFFIKDGEIYPSLSILKVGGKGFERVFSEVAGGGNKDSGRTEK